ncbi:hypothetical protein LR48_Vigan11g016300 [Vigna angularis]|uniref:Uncharacterized protein n=1 Tax=Phaseolus angularis TaxID=3914 RepID=A0A0L9VPY3_PHAAN|nr:hypothetical protein LR48_Vigan11g016300 [Vigna angularis]
MRGCSNHPTSITGDGMTVTQNQSARTTVLGFLCNWNITAALTANTITPQRHHDWNTTIEGRDSYGSSDEDDDRERRRRTKARSTPTPKTTPKTNTHTEDGSTGGHRTETKDGSKEKVKRDGSTEKKCPGFNKERKARG